MARGVRDIDRGWKNLRKEMKEANGSYTTVGIHENETHTADDGGARTPMAVIAAVHEFGTDDGRIPRRAFLSTAFERYRAELEVFRDKLLKGIFLQRFTFRQALGLLGEKHQAQVQKTITDGPWVENAKSTIDAKGSSRPLIDTSQMRNSVRHVEHFDE